MVLLQYGTVPVLPLEARRLLVLESTLLELLLHCLLHLYVL
jgi:hypothetical protein